MIFFSLPDVTSIRIASLAIRNKSKTALFSPDLSATGARMEVIVSLMGVFNAHPRVAALKKKQDLAPLITTGSVGQKERSHPRTWVSSSFTLIRYTERFIKGLIDGRLV